MNVLPIGPTQPKAQSARGGLDLMLVPTTSAGERAQQLMMQAKALSLEHLKALRDTLAEARALSESVVHAGDLYVPGLHDFSKRLAEELLWREKTLEALTERQKESAAGPAQ